MKLRSSTEAGKFHIRAGVAEDTFHKPSDIACHASLLTEFLGGDLSELLPMDVESLFSSVHVA